MSRNAWIAAKKAADITRSAAKLIRFKAKHAHGALLSSTASKKPHGTPVEKNKFAHQ